MADITTIFLKILQLVIVIAIGYAATKARVITQEGKKHLSELVLTITNPCSVLFAVLSGENTLTKKQVLLLTAIAFVAYGFLILVAHFLPKVLREKKDAGVWRFMMVFSNVGFFGFPVVRAVFVKDSSAVFYAAIFNLVFQLLAYTYGARQISGDREEGRLRPKLLLKPIIIASLLAYVIYFTGWKAPKFMTDTVGFMANVTSPLCMLIIGSSLAIVPVGRVFTRWKLYPVLILKQIGIPVAVYFALSGFVTNETILGICVIMMAMPVAALTALFCTKYERDGELAASGVFLSTLLSVATIPLLMWLLF
ncbi:MAG: AEC family transporter [Clostridia bacterium]|nr:AEC family transporter [Clostridia bacterium]